MKTALVTDLHANREAVEAVIAHARARGAQRFALLGDFVGYGADPAWVVDTVRELVRAGSIAVRGNHDEAAVRGAAPSTTADARRVIEWTVARLDPSQLEFLASLPLTRVVGGCLYVHANAWAPAGWAYIEGQSEARRSLQATQCPYTFCGHVHEPKLYHLSQQGTLGVFLPTPGVPIPVPSHRKWLAIPGSAGQPRDGNPAAGYALFDDETEELRFERVPYDHASAAAKIRAAALPEQFALRLGTGT
jgi:diadenosine tetraphosphatase ApaH/serine/threonine PP2A family protein phosphatase